MALLAKYTTFLANPTTDSLAPSASLHYITTLTTLKEPIGILKHLKAQQQVVTKKKEAVLSVVESSDSLCVETETTIQFVNGGGTYLPGLDDNFLADKTVTFPVLHIVNFDPDQKILQIRLHWDQACVLKAVDTIGARGRNWPIQSGQDQARLIASSTAAAPHASPAADVVVEEERTGRPKSRGVDPHSSLSLFAPREAPEREESPQNACAPRASAKPAPREWGELFAGEEQPDPEGLRSPSPSKLDNPIKSGAGRHYHDIRLFSPESANATEDKGIKTDAKKYKHFEFGEAEFQPSPIKNNRTKHMSQWDFSDFVTPQKAKERKTAYPSRNFDLSEVAGADESAGMKAPVFTKPVPQARGGLTPHFEFGDEEGVSDNTDNRPLIARTSKSMGLYEDNITGECDFGAPSAAPQENRPLSNITNSSTNNTHRGTFEPHWKMTDSANSPSGNENASGTGHVRNVSEATKRVARDMGAHWEMTDESPKDQQQPRGIKILGNGSGSSRVADRGGFWDY